MGTPVIPVTAQLTNKHPRQVAAQTNSMTQDARGAVTLNISDERPEDTSVIYLYNVLDGYIGPDAVNAHVINQPPCFPAVLIPPCEKGRPFSFTKIPRWVRVRLEKPGTTEFEYRTEDGRKHATSLLNPAAYPGTEWNSQLGNWRSNDQFGNNLNLLGCFWSLNPPALEADNRTPLLTQSPELEKELKQFRAKARLTMEALIRTAESAHASGRPQDITPMQHFAMDYLGKQATWHMSHDHMISCPTCGAPVKEGIAYHKNDFGEKCPVDYEKCRTLGILPQVQAAPGVEEAHELTEEEAELATAARTKAGGKKKTR